MASEQKTYPILVYSQPEPSPELSFEPSRYRAEWTYNFARHYLIADHIILKSKMTANKERLARPSASDYQGLQQLLIRQQEAIQHLSDQVATLTAKLDQVLTGSNDSSPDVVDPDFDDAIQLARDFFRDHKEPTYPDELAEQLGISISLAVELCEALVKEGQVVA